MTDSELEKQAKLWHVESTLEAKQSATLEAQLQKAFPKARTRHRWKQASAVLALACLPISGITALVVSTSPKATIERFDYDDYLPSTSLDPDGEFYNFAVETICPIYQPTNAPSKTVQSLRRLFPEYIFPKASFYVLSRLFVSDWVGTVNDKPVHQFFPSFYEKDDWTILPEIDYSVLCEKGDCRILSVPPLPGYDRAWAVDVIPEGIIGFCQRVLNKHGYVEELVNVIWKNGKPELISDKKKSELRFKNRKHGAFIDMNGNGDVLYADKVYSKGKYINVLSRLESLQIKEVCKVEPSHIGKNAMLVGSGECKGVTFGAIWTSPTAKPRPLWEPLFSFSSICLSCEDIDDEGKVVGMLQNPATEITTPYIWKDGRYVELQKLLPYNSGWELTSASRVKGRFVVGKGRYRGVPSVYRLKLPPGAP